MPSVSHRMKADFRTMRLKEKPDQVEADIYNTSVSLCVPAHIVPYPVIVEKSYSKCQPFQIPREDRGIMQATFQS